MSEIEFITARLYYAISTLKIKRVNSYHTNPTPQKEQKTKLTQSLADLYNY